MILPCTYAQAICRSRFLIRRYRGGGQEEELELELEKGGFRMQKFSLLLLWRCSFMPVAAASDDDDESFYGKKKNFRPKLKTCC